MGVDIKVVFYTKEKVTEKFIKNVVAAAEKSGGRYANPNEKLEDTMKQALKPNTKVFYFTENSIKKKISIDNRATFHFFLASKNPNNPGNNIYGSGVGVSISVGIEEGYTVVTLRTSDSNLREAVENEELFFTLIRNIAKAINPIVGYGDIENIFDDESFDPSEFFTNYLKKTRVPRLATILFLGDKYVKKFNKQALLKTPALIVEEIGKGILIIMDYIYNHKELKDQKDCSDAYSYLYKILREEKKKLQ